MAFWKRLADRSGEEATRDAPPIPDDGSDQDLEAEVSVGGITVAVSIYRNWPRDPDQVTSGIDLRDQEELGLAGAIVCRVFDLQRHPDVRTDAFALGRTVHIVADPDFRAVRGALAVRSDDGRRQAGYVVPEDTRRLPQTTPQVGLVVWEALQGRPPTRVDIRVLVGPSLHLRVLGTRAEAELIRRLEAEAARQRRDEARAAERAERTAVEERRRTEGVCVDCGRPLVRTGGRGRPAIRCDACRTGDRG
jgi:hypothetical protein